MSRVPYENVAAEADRIIVKMALASTWERAIYYWDMYIEYIESCGWSNQEFDNETLQRIDVAWSNIKRQNWN